MQEYSRPDWHGKSSLLKWVQMRTYREDAKHPGRSNLVFDPTLGANSAPTSQNPNVVQNRVRDRSRLCQRGQRNLGRVSISRSRLTLRMVRGVLGTLAWAAAILLALTRDGIAQAIDSTLWVTDGRVNAIVRDGGTIYIAGSFANVGPPPLVGGGGATLDSSTGLPRVPYEQVEGTVNAVAPDGSGGWYLGGAFTRVRGQPRSNLAHLDGDGNLTAWDPGASDSTFSAAVFALAVSESTVYVGGFFTNIGGAARNNIAALDASSGRATAWNPNSDDVVLALAVSGSAVYAGGDFSNVGGAARNRIAALDASSARATAWDPNALPGGVRAIAVSESTVYVGGDFGFIGGQQRLNIAALSASSGLPTAWAPNAFGGVYALAVSGSTVYAGGQFSFIGGQTWNNIAALDVSSGNATDFFANANGPVFAIAVSGSTVYASGSFTSIGGQARNNIAALRISGLATAWNPNADNIVRALAVSAGTVYAGGQFNSIGKQARNNIAALDASTGILTAWDPNATGGTYGPFIYALAVSGSTVYAGGTFTRIGGQTRNNIAALDASSGLATPWDPNVTDFTYPNVYALAVSESTVYVGGAFSGIGGQTRRCIAALSASSGLATPWDPGADNPVYALAVSGSTVYAGGAFFGIGGQPRNNIAALDASSGLATPWDPNATGFNSPRVEALAVSGSTVYAGGLFSDIGGNSRSCIAALDASSGLATTWNPGANNEVLALAVSGNTVYAGGGFGMIGGQLRYYLAALDATSGLATAWNPSPSEGVVALEVGGSTVYAGGRNYLARIQRPVFNFAAAPMSMTVTTGDTASSAIEIWNTGMTPLTITGLEAPSTAFSLSPAPPFQLAPESQSTVAVRFHPAVEAPRDSGLLRPTSDDPYGPDGQAVPVSFEALGLHVGTNAFVTGEFAPLGQAVTIQAIALGGCRVERGSVHFRARCDSLARCDSTFAQVDLVPADSLPTHRAFFGIIPGTAIRESGVDYYVSIENSGVSATDPPGAPRDSLFRLVVAAPATVTATPRPTSRFDFVRDSTITVDVALPVGAIFASGALHYRRGGESTYVTDSLATNGPAGILTGTIPGTDVGPRGLEYWVEVNTLTSHGPLTFPATHPDATPENIRVTVLDVKEEQLHAGGRCRMLGLPVDFAPKVPGVDGLLASEFGPYDPTRWRAFRYMPETKKTLEVTAGDQRFAVVPGRAFWLITRDSHQVTTGIAAALSTSSSAEYPIVLGQGWNMIADPFDFPVAWSAVRKPAAFDSLQAYDGTNYIVSNRLEPFAGYFVWSAAAAETLWVPPIEAPPPGPVAASGMASAPAATIGSVRATADPAAGGDSWFLTLRAKTDRAVDGSSEIGVAAAADEGRDALDQPKPPPPPGAWVDLALRLPHEQTSPDLYRTDLRAPSAEGHVWEIELRSSTAGEEVVIEALQGAPLPKGLLVRLIDHEQECMIDLNRADGSLASYRLLSMGPGRPYRITMLAGSAAFLSQSPEGELETPSHLQMDAAVPNPSSAAMRIRFGLPTAQAVTLEVLDVQGRRVAVPLERAWQGAGYHALLWDGAVGRGNTGERVAAGVYFLRLTTNAGNISRRLVRVE